MKTPKIDKLGTLAIIGVVAFWTIGPIAIRYLSGYLDFWTQNFLRYAAACLLWLPFLFISFRNGSLDGRVWKVALLPAVANIAMQSFWAVGLYYIEPAFMSLLSKSSMIWVICFSLIFFSEERVLLKSVWFWMGMVLSVAGVAGVLVNREGFAAGSNVIGISLCLVSSFLWAVYTVTVKRAFRDIDVRAGFSVISIYTVFGLGVLCFMFGDIGASLEMEAWPWFYVVVSGFLSIAFAHVLYYYSIKRIGAMIPSMVLLGLPFSVLAFSNVIFGETLSSLQWVFGMVLVVGCGMSIWSQSRLVD
ncbi:MAG: DMT family transporter [Planctomycetes bacterium]|nr:DMT family transporter [Planctomycetota bacterium]